MIAPFGAYDSGMGEQGPPPGGYGLHEKPVEKIPQPEPKAPPPPMAPFRTLPMLDAPPPRSRRWVGIPIIGIALLSLRMLLLCSRMSEPSHDYTYTPTDFQLTIPTVSYAPPIAPPVSLGAVATDSHATYYVKRGELWVQPKSTAAAPSWFYTGTGMISDVAIVEGEVYVLESGELHHVYSSGVSSIVGSGSFYAMAVDGKQAYLVGASSIQRITLPGGAQTTIASTDPATEEDLHGPVAIAQGFLWFGRGDGVGRISIKGGHQIIGKPFAPGVEMLGLASAPDALLVATDGGVLELSNGKPKPLTPDGWDTACHDIVTAGKWVYLTYQDAAGWAVGRMPRAGGPVDPVVHTVIQPHLATEALPGHSGTAIYSTPEGIRSVPDPE
jgi:hypothetical protein